MKNPIFLCLLLVLFSLVLPTSSFAQEGADGFRVYLPLVNEIKGSSGGTIPVSVSPPVYVVPERKYNGSGQLLSPFDDGSIQAEGVPYVGPLPECTHEQMKALEALVANGVRKNILGEYGCLLVPDINYEVGQDPLEMTKPVSSANVTWSTKFNINFLNCVTACGSNTGITLLRGTITPGAPGLNPNKSWNDFFFANMIQVSDQTNNVICQSGSSLAPTLYIGVGRGRLSNDVTVGTRRVYWEEIRGNDCYGHSTSYTLSFKTGMPAEIYKDSDGVSTSYWTGRVNINSNWVTLFSHVEMAFSGSADTLAAGQVIRAKNNDHSNVTSPLVLVPNLTIRRYGNSQIPWSDNAILKSYGSTQIYGKTSVITNSPFKLTSTTTVSLGGWGDFTTISSMVQ